MERYSGNHIIDGDDGSHPQSPYYNGQNDSVSPCCGSEYEMLEMTNCCNASFIGESEKCSECKEYASILEDYSCVECKYVFDFPIEQWEFDANEKENYYELRKDDIL